MIDHIFASYKVPGPYTDDIREHLETLKSLAEECEHVTEMGFRVGTSFSALLAGRPKKAVTYDIKLPEPAVDMFKAAAQIENIDVELHEKSTLDIEIEPTDMLFIDTLHTYTQLKEELRLHAHKAKKYLVFHDTETFGLVGEDGQAPGLMDAIQELLIKDHTWYIKEKYTNNNGLLVLERR